MKFTRSDPDLFPAVYWFWHSVPTADEIRRQIADMDESGIKTFLIQARLAFPIEEYLGEGYFAAYRLAMQEARARGMTAGIYDDYNWDSGQAGGRSVKLNDNARERHLFWTSGQVKAGVCSCRISDIHSLMYSGMGQAVLDWIYEGGQPRWDDWQVFKVLAFPQKELVSFTNDVIDVTAYCAIKNTGNDACEIKLELPHTLNLDGYQIAAFAAARCATSRLINYLSPEAVDAFITAGYEPYRQHLGDYFGRTIKFMFFDHPYGGFYGWEECSGNLGNSLMFDSRLAEKFLSDKGYSLEQALLSFIHELGDETPKYRADFFEVYGSLGRETFFGKLSAWTKKNGLGLSGHELLAHVGAWGYTEGFTFLDARTNFAADYFAIDAYRTQTAVDASNYHAQISAKLGDSVAKANGRRGCLIEQYAVSESTDVPGGAGQWGLTLAQLRSQAIRHTFLGASQFIFHGFYQTDGSANNLDLYKNPRFDFAPGLNFEPWFEKYSQFAREMSELAALLAKANPASSAAVLFPLRTWWAEGGEGIFSQESEKWFRYFLEHNIQFDIVNEEQLEVGRVENSDFLIGKERYKALIFPGTGVVRSEKILAQLSVFVSNGGLFIASGKLPEASQGKGRCDEIKAGFLQLVDSRTSAHYFPQFPSTEKLAELFAKNEISFGSLTDGNGHPFWSWKGTLEGDPLILVFNDQAEDDHLTVQVSRDDLEPATLDIESGQVKSWPWFEKIEGGINLHKDMAPGEVCAFILKQKPGGSGHLVGANCLVEEISRDEKGIGYLQILTDDSKPVELTIVSESKPLLRTQIQSVERCEKISETLWRMTVAPGKSHAQVKLKGWIFSTPEQPGGIIIDINKGWETQGFPTYAGMGSYRSSFALEHIDPELVYELILPRVETTAEIHLNDSLAGTAGWPPYRLKLPRKLLRVGKNDLQIRVLNTGANYYYHNTPFQPKGLTPSGLIGSPYIQLLLKIEINF